jgi:hypothetical protein
MDFQPLFAVEGLVANAVEGLVANEGWVTIPVIVSSRRRGPKVSLYRDCHPAILDHRGRGLVTEAAASAIFARIRDSRQSLRRRLPAGERRPLIVIYDWGRNLSDLQTAKLLELTPRLASTHVLGGRGYRGDSGACRRVNCQERNWFPASPSIELPQNFALN